MKQQRSLKRQLLLGTNGYSRWLRNVQQTPILIFQMGILQLL